MVFVFSVELLLKLVGFGLKNFMKDQVNIFDALIVFISITELILSLFVNREIIAILRVLKALRAIRMLKLTKYNQGMLKVLG